MFYRSTLRIPLLHVVSVSDKLFLIGSNISLWNDIIDIDLLLFKTDELE